jgi:hypothetical protein
MLEVVALHSKKKVIISKTSLRRLMDREKIKDVRFCFSGL